MKKYNNHSPRRQLLHNHTNIVLCFLLCFFFATAKLANGANLVSGKYISTSGKNIVLRLKIGKPCPSNLIVEQSISSGNSIKSTSPKARKINANGGTTKWLFRNTQPGNLTLTTVLGKPLQGNVSSVVRYRDPKSGQFTEQRITP